MDLSILIVTHGRPEGLARTLRSCVAQRNALGLATEIVVVDNHPSGDAEPVVRSLQAPDGPPIRYVRELTRNMSVLRNRAFSEARGRYAAVIDDDETAAPDWTDQLIGVLRRSGAEVAVGPRYAEFEAGPPPYDPSGASFVRDFELREGEFVEVTTPWGKPRLGLGTGNSAFDLSRCTAPDEPLMDPRFGHAGGEDSEMFVRLHRRGRRIVWAARARVTETVPAHRTAPAYRLLRTRREAQHYAAIYLEHSTCGRWTRLELLFKGWLQLTVGVLLCLVTLEYGSRRRLLGRRIAAQGWGKITWRRPVGYISEPAH